MVIGLHFDFFTQQTMFYLAQLYSPAYHLSIPSFVSFPFVFVLFLMPFILLTISTARLPLKADSSKSGDHGCNETYVEEKESDR